MTTTTILTVAAVVIIALLVWRMMRTIFKFIFIGVIALLAFWWISNGGLGNFIENPTGKLPRLGGFERNARIGARSDPQTRGRPQIHHQRHA